MMCQCKVLSYTKGQPYPAFNRKAMAGIWRLSEKKSLLPVFGIKQFDKTRYQDKDLTDDSFPKSPTIRQAEDQRTNSISLKGSDEILLMLKEDGSFSQYSLETESDDEKEDDDIGDDEIGKSISENERLLKEKFGGDAISPGTQANSGIVGLGIMKGNWDFQDGNLILAAERPKNVNAKEVHDTVLVGRVVAETTTAPGTETSTLSEEVTDEKSLGSTVKEPRTNDSLAQDLKNDGDKYHLTIPEGKVEIGKFMYPRNHPSFFELPIYDPVSMGTFHLQQIFSKTTEALNPTDEEEFEERYKKNDLCGKRYYVTSKPFIYKAKGRKRWSIKYNKYVEEKTKKQKALEKEADKYASNIRVMEVELFANNTFATIAGLGSDVILRGKWHIVGENRDQLWMQVWLFGFGRSAPGGCYSEGSFTHNDRNSYWGMISEVNTTAKDFENRSESESFFVKDVAWNVTESTVPDKRIQIEGAVMFGVGLEPTKIADFTMIEKMGSDDEDFNRDGDEDEWDIVERTLESLIDQVADEDFDISPDAFQ